METSRAQEGCHSAELTISEDGTKAIVTASWADRAAYDVWTSRGDRSDQRVQLNELLATPIDDSTVGQVFDVALDGTPADVGS